MALVGLWTNQAMSNSGWSTAQMQHNALDLYNYFTAQGWSINAICAMLGNMQVESYINPGQWQIGSTIEGIPADGIGFGLVQWTPWTKFTNWAGSDYRTNFEKQKYRIIYELNNGLQWIVRASYNNMTFRQFSVSNATIDYLTEVFVRCYENPADWQSSIAIRRSNANAWYQYLSGQPTPLTVPIWLLFKIKEANK